MALPYLPFDIHTYCGSLGKYQRAQKTYWGNLYAHKCSGTKNLDIASKDLEFLGKGYVNKSNVVSNVSSWFYLEIGLIIGLIVLFVIRIRSLLLKSEKIPNKHW